ncbi:MAG TPA: hypothetical protein PLE45_09040 [Spirochaetota bacterium]|nr:hypothetical protein [Spirochaetota bacterium]HOL57208.1 hypothetical protein [Spirochaetota bacterium]HPP04845.1 hypothetical protein [Spirochaetota bacterium]
MKIIAIFIFAVCFNLFSQDFQTKDDNKKFLIIETEGHTSSISKIEITPDNKDIITVSYDKTIRIWDLETGLLKRTFRGYMSDGARGMHYYMSLSPDGKMIATGGWLYGDYDGDPMIGAIRIYDYNSGKIVKVLTGLTNVVNALSYSPDGKYLAAGSGNGNVIIWNTKDYKEYFNNTLHSNPCYGIAFSPDSKMLATVSTDLSGILTHMVSPCHNLTS